MLPAARDHFLHDLLACRLEWTQAAPGQEPDSFVLITAVDNIYTIAGDCVVERCAGILGNELEESIPPGISGHREYLFSDRL